MNFYSNEVLGKFLMIQYYILCICNINAIKTVFILPGIFLDVIWTRMSRLNARSRKMLAMVL